MEDLFNKHQIKKMTKNTSDLLGETPMLRDRHVDHVGTADILARTTNVKARAIGPTLDERISVTIQSHFVDLSLKSRSTRDGDHDLVILHNGLYPKNSVNRCHVVDTARQDIPPLKLGPLLTSNRRRQGSGRIIVASATLKHVIALGTTTLGRRLDGSARTDRSKNGRSTHPMKNRKRKPIAAPSKDGLICPLCNRSARSTHPIKNRKRKHATVVRCPQKIRDLRRTRQISKNRTRCRLDRGARTDRFTNSPKFASVGTNLANKTKNGKWGRIHIFEYSRRCFNRENLMSVASIYFFNFL